jgi:hypothetical protein
VRSDQSSGKRYAKGIDTENCEQASENMAQYLPGLFISSLYGPYWHGIDRGGYGCSPPASPRLIVPGGPGKKKPGEPHNRFTGQDSHPMWHHWSLPASRRPNFGVKPNCVATLCTWQLSPNLVILSAFGNTFRTWQFFPQMTISLHGSIGKSLRISINLSILQ